MYLTVDVAKLGEDRVANRPRHKIVLVIEELRSLCDQQVSAASAEGISEATKDQLKTILNKIAAMCTQHPGNRFLAFEARFEACFTQLLRVFDGATALVVNPGADFHLLQTLLHTFAAFAKAQAPLLSADTLRALVSLAKHLQEAGLAAEQRNSLLAAAFRCVSTTCEFSENNKVTLCGAGACGLAVATLKLSLDPTVAANDEAVASVCGFIGALLKQDDANAIEQTQDRALALVERDGICLLVSLGKRRFERLSADDSYEADGSRHLAQLFTTLGALCIRNEYCEQMAAHGALQLGFACLNWCLPHEVAHRGNVEVRLKALKGCLVLLRALAANDAVKAQIVTDCPLAFTVLVHLADAFVERAAVCDSAFALLGTLLLRSPTHVSTLMERCGEQNVADTAIRALQVHVARLRSLKNPSKAELDGSLKTLAHVCTFVRNAVVRNREFCDAFLKRAVDGRESSVSTELESLLNELLAATSDADVVDAAKGALRDLGCRVDLRECWTGKRAEIPR